MSQLNQLRGYASVYLNLLWSNRTNNSTTMVDPENNKIGTLYIDGTDFNITFDGRFPETGDNLYMYISYMKSTGSTVESIDGVNNNSWTSWKCHTWTGINGPSINGSISFPKIICKNGDENNIHVVNNDGRYKTWQSPNLYNSMFNIFLFCFVNAIFTFADWTI